MNAPPPREDLNSIDPRSTAALEAEIAEKAEAARRAVAARHPGEMGKSETDAGKGIWGSLGIGKKK